MIENKSNSLHDVLNLNGVSLTGILVQCNLKFNSEEEEMCVFLMDSC